MDSLLLNCMHFLELVHLLADLLIPLAAKMAEEPFKLLIMDSITANLRVDFSGRGELADRQQKLGQMMARLRKVIPDLQDSNPIFPLFTCHTHPIEELGPHMEYAAVAAQRLQASRRRRLLQHIPYIMLE